MRGRLPPADVDDEGVGCAGESMVDGMTLSVSAQIAPGLPGYRADQPIH